MEKIHKCKYCYYKSPNLEEVTAHEEELHGCYRDENPRKAKSQKSKPKLVDAIWHARLLPIHNASFRIDALYEHYDDGSIRMFTDDLKYGDHLEIIYDKNIGMFNIKNIDKLRKEWRRKHGEDVSDNVETFERFIDEM